jgi:hypothetical protein
MQAPLNRNSGTISRVLYDPSMAIQGWASPLRSFRILYGFAAVIVWLGVKPET